MLTEPNFQFHLKTRRFNKIVRKFFKHHCISTSFFGVNPARGNGHEAITTNHEIILLDNFDNIYLYTIYYTIYENNI